MEEEIVVLSECEITQGRSEFSAQCDCPCDCTDSSCGDY